MYSIFAHISGIAILEICFFFYYVGPMETRMFEKTVKQLTNEPITEMNIAMIEQPDYKLDVQKYLYIAFNPGNMQMGSITDTTIDEFSEKNQEEILYEMEELRDKGIARRDEKNSELFVEIVEKWCILCGVTLVLFTIERMCCNKNKKEEDGITTVFSDDDIDGIELGEGRYRKGSIDVYSDDPLLDTPDEHVSYTDRCCNTFKQKCNRKFVNNIVYYTSFGGCLLTFQYYFFQHVIYYYMPLSIEEVKYLIYVAFLSQTPSIPQL
jgi:hypothetical protein